MLLDCKFSRPKVQALVHFPPSWSISHWADSSAIEEHALSLIIAQEAAAETGSVAAALSQEASSSVASSTGVGSGQLCDVFSSVAKTVATWSYRRATGGRSGFCNRQRFQAELELYLRLYDVPMKGDDGRKANPLDWCKKMGQEDCQPLAKLAESYFAIQATFALSKCKFSQDSLLISWVKRKWLCRKWLSWKWISLDRILVE